MVLTKLPMRQPSKKRAHQVMAKPASFVAKRGKRIRLLESDEDSSHHSLLHGQCLNQPAGNDPRTNVEMQSQNSGPSEHSDHSGQEDQ